VCVCLQRSELARGAVVFVVDVIATNEVSK